MEEILAIDARLVALLDNTEKPIHFVIDVRDLTQVPTLDQGLKLHHLRHAKAGWVMMIGSNQNAMLRFLTSVAIKIFGSKYKECSSEEEAAEFLKQVDPDLAAIRVKNL